MLAPDLLTTTFHHLALYDLQELNLCLFLLESKPRVGTLKALNKYKQMPLPIVAKGRNLYESLFRLTV